MSNTLSEKTLQDIYQNSYLLMEQGRNLVYVGATCYLCYATLESEDKYSISKKCKCLNEVRVLGGLENPRLYAKNTTYARFVTVYDDEKFDMVRNYATRGCFDKEKHSIVYVPLSTLPDEVLERALISGGADWHLKLLAKEIQYRFENKIIIEDGKDRYL